MKNDFTPPRMETIKKTAEIFGLPFYFVKMRVMNGEVVAVKAGRKYLVNIEKFSEFLQTTKITPPDQEASGGKLQPIEIKR